MLFIGTVLAPICGFSLFPSKFYHWNSKQTLSEEKKDLVLRLTVSNNLAGDETFIEATSIQSV